MKRHDFITKYATFTDEHFQSLINSIQLGYGTFGSYRALQHCEVITLYCEDNELKAIKEIFRKSGYELLTNKEE